MPLSNDNDGPTDYGPYMTKLWPYMIVLVSVMAIAIYIGWYSA